MQTTPLMPSRNFSQNANHPSCLSAPTFVLFKAQMPGLLPKQPTYQKQQPNETGIGELSIFCKLMLQIDLRLVMSEPCFERDGPCQATVLTESAQTRRFGAERRNFAEDARVRASTVLDDRAVLR